MTQHEPRFATRPCGCQPMGRFTFELLGRTLECPSMIALCRTHMLEAEQHERKQRKAYDAEHGDGAWEALQIASEAYS